MENIKQVMKKQFNKVAGLVLVFMVTIALSGVVSAQKVDGKKPSTTTNNIKARPRPRALLASATASNARPYNLAKEFAFATSDAMEMDSDDVATNFTIVDLVYMIDELEGQPEAASLQKILKDVVRGNKYAYMIAHEIDAVSKTYLARLTVEQKWYFNVGQTQANLMLAAWASDEVAINTRLKEMQSLAKIAPKGTALTVLNAINGLSKYVAKATYTKDDFKAIVNDAKVITTEVTA